MQQKELKYEIIKKKKCDPTQKTKGEKKKMEEMLYTVTEVSKILKTNPAYVYKLINARLLPALRLGGMKVRKTALQQFLKKYEGMDLRDVNNIKEMKLNEIDGGAI